VKFSNMFRFSEGMPPEGVAGRSLHPSSRGCIGSNRRSHEGVNDDEGGLQSRRRARLTADVAAHRSRRWARDSTSLFAVSKASIAETFTSGSTPMISQPFTE